MSKDAFLLSPKLSVGRPTSFNNLKKILGFASRLERATHIDFNRDGIIGRLPDYGGYGMGGYQPMYGGYGGGMGYGLPGTGFASPYGYGFY
ncbi:unnamed protein product [Didymodactylos carnosus]|uniref:Uncharacterized protein n=1 Tax=Didymodactylos carnosus TaxID=1234261 RepID=A0A8S2RF94_9BILA|nr:unnamed protein product [Didymodactylos carnosus]CAF4157024.1 unnamed protein product [Didymodactylos carnosus]